MPRLSLSLSSVRSWDFVCKQSQDDRATSPPSFSESQQQHKRPFSHTLGQGEFPFGLKWTMGAFKRGCSVGLMEKKAAKGAKRSLQARQPLHRPERERPG